MSSALLLAATSPTSQTSLRLGATATTVGDSEANVTIVPTGSMGLAEVARLSCDSRTAAEQRNAGDERGRLYVFNEELARPIRIEIEHDDGVVVVSDPHTGVFGAGSTPQAAILDLHQALREHLDVLSRQERLSSELLRQMKRLQSYFVSK